MATVPTPAELSYEQTHINESRVTGLLVSNILCLGLAYVAVALRFLCRRVGRIKYDWDDWLILLGLVRYRLLLTHEISFHRLIRCD